jgi:hypothetical protein
MGFNSGLKGLNLKGAKILFNPLNVELNRICHLLALLGAHHILHVSGMRVKHALRKTSKAFSSVILSQILVCSCA